MGELVGQINQDYHVKPGSREQLNSGVRMLGESGLTEFLKHTADQLSNTRFYYSDITGIYPNGPRPGYVLDRDDLSVAFSSDGKSISLSSLTRETSASGQRSIHYNQGPSGLKLDPGVAFSYLYKVGMIPIPVEAFSLV